MENKAQGDENSTNIEGDIAGMRQGTTFQGDVCGKLVKATAPLRRPEMAA